jgi:ferredoxin-type protein NapG
MTSRRDILKKLFKGAAVAGSGGLIWGMAIEETKADVATLRPPGAINDKDFLKACIKCGKCVEACPYDTLKLATPGDNSGIGTPWFEPRKIPCYMCTDYPCTEACPSGALNLKELSKENNPPDIHRESCIAYWGIQCDACYRACPLMDSAIKLEYDKNITTGKHANLKPVVYSDFCTGCGVCEHACVVEKAAIHVLPGTLALGEVGNHYIKSWDKADEQRINKVDEAKNTDDKDIESALDYLNNDEELLNE